MTSINTVSHCALVTARQGFSHAVGIGLSGLVVPARGMPGCLHFSVQRSQCDEHLWQVAGVWSDQEAMRAWFTSPSMQVFSDLLQDMLVSSLDVHTFSEPGIERAASAA
ncbi:putative quinol monooxygenase [Pseudomonas sp. UBA4194]|uniref:putative quinol monooxygenase n=1 Tax=Pseudomonas sp. UBA4194 TaxID=1947317 RepID=UPI0025E31271|nr:antibiotic biosynthesis monooxygenase family protein [Pseudomonas sp. UBA4194]